MGLNVSGKTFEDMFTDKLKNNRVKLKIPFGKLSPELKEASAKLAEKTNPSSDSFISSK